VKSVSRNELGMSWALDLFVLSARLPSKTVILWGAGSLAMQKSAFSHLIRLFRVQAKAILQLN
jgi:hypothetical protein